MSKNLFEQAVQLSKKSWMGKIVGRPITMMVSKVLELVSRSTGVTVKWRASTFWRRPMLAVIPDPVSLSIIRYGFFEEFFTRTLLDRLKPNMKFVDVGAHFGYFSLLASYIVGEQGQVHAFEPTPVTFSILKQNCKGVKNIILNNLAVYSTSKSLSFTDYGLAYACLNRSTPVDLSRHKLPVKKRGEYIARTISLDDYCRENNLRPDFIKLDAEGAEEQILKGASWLINDVRPLWSIEVGNQGAELYKNTDNIIRSLIDVNYQAYKYSDDGALEIYHIGQHWGKENLLFVPNEKN